MSWTCMDGHAGNKNDLAYCLTPGCGYNQIGEWCYEVKPEPLASSMPTAAATFATAHKLISGDRRADYGEVEASFKRVALCWSGLLGVDVTPQKVCLCMTALKLCREANAHKDDSIYDAVGYLGLLAEIEASRGKINPAS